MHEVVAMALDSRDAVKLLREAYEEKGYIRVKMDQRQERRRSGWEIRLRAGDSRQARQWSQALSALGLQAGSPYARGANTVVPLYGRMQVEEFLKRVKPRSKNEIPKLPSNRDMRRSRRSFTGGRRKTGATSR